MVVRIRLLQMAVIVNKKQVLKDKDVIIIANAKLLFSSNGINYTIYDEGINLEVKDITKTVSSSKGKINISKSYRTEYWLW